MDVAPVSAMPCPGSMVTRRGLLASWARHVGSSTSGLLVETFDVITVTSSSTAYDTIWVGYKGAETKLLNLFAMGAFAPPCHK